MAKSLDSWKKEFHAKMSATERRLETLLDECLDVQRQISAIFEFQFEEDSNNVEQFRNEEVMHTKMEKIGMDSNDHQRKN